MGGISANWHSGLDLWRRHGRLMLAVMALVLGVGGAGIALMPESHVAAALLALDPLPDADDDAAARIANEIELLRSHKVLQLTAERLGLVSDTLPATRRQAIIAELDNAVSIERRGASYLVSIAARAAAPEAAAAIANMLAQAFIDTELQGRLDRIDAERTILEARLADAETAMAKADAAFTAGLTIDNAQPVVESSALHRLRETAERAHNRHDVLAERIDALQNQQALQMPGARLVRAAATPEDMPTHDKASMAAALLAVAIVAGFIAGTGAHYLGRGFAADDIGSVLAIRQVAIVPVQKMRRRDDGEWQLSAADFVLDEPISPFAEAVRRMKAGIDQALLRNADDRHPAGRGGVVMVTSALRGEGKTTLALALARAYALAGKATLLIDCDLRHPGLHSHLGLEPSSGLVDYLGGLPGSAGLRAILAVDGTSGARVVVGARDSAQANDRLFAGANFSGLIAAATQNFDMVLLDTPPVGEMADGLYLAGFADVATLVVRWASTGRKPAASAVEALRDSLPRDAEMLAVLNQRAGAIRPHPAQAARVPVPAAARNYDNTNVIRLNEAVNHD